MHIQPLRVVMATGKVRRMKLGQVKFTDRVTEVMKVPVHC